MQKTESVRWSEDVISTEPFFSRLIGFDSSCPPGFRMRLHVTTSLSTGCPEICLRRLAPWAGGPGCPELSKSRSDAKLFTYTLTSTPAQHPHSGVARGRNAARSCWLWCLHLPPAAGQLAGSHRGVHVGPCDQPAERVPKRPKPVGKADRLSYRALDTCGVSGNCMVATVMGRAFAKGTMGCTAAARERSSMHGVCEESDR